jgi:hypothetical protein
LQSTFASNDLAFDGPVGRRNDLLLNLLRANHHLDRDVRVLRINDNCFDTWRCADNLP